MLTFSIIKLLSYLITVELQELQSLGFGKLHIGKRRAIILLKPHPTTLSQDNKILKSSTVPFQTYTANYLNVDSMDESNKQLCLTTHPHKELLVDILSQFSDDSENSFIEPSGFIGTTYSINESTHTDITNIEESTPNEIIIFDKPTQHLEECSTQTSEPKTPSLIEYNTVVKPQDKTLTVNSTVANSTQKTLANQFNENDNNITSDSANMEVPLSSHSNDVTLCMSSASQQDNFICTPHQDHLSCNIIPLHNNPKRFKSNSSDLDTKPQSTYVNLDQSNLPQGHTLNDLAYACTIALKDADY